MTAPVVPSSPPELGALVGSVLHFEDPSLLRATRLSDVLHRSGQIFASSVGTECTYGLSMQVERIDVFISHNWSVGRLRKFVLLAMHFNLDMGMRAAFAVMVVVGTLVYLLGRVGRVTAGTNPALTPICTMLTFFVMLFFGHEIKALLGADGKLVFVDRMCIHQTNEYLKKQGIGSLGAFLHHSSCLLVCFTELYFQRLWTVYEFATFLMVHGDERPGSVHVAPTNLPILVIVTAFFFCAGVVLNRVCLAIALDSSFIKAGGSLLVICTLLQPLRAWARQRREADAMFQKFAVSDAACDVEADRALVTRNIVALTKHFSFVGVDADDDDALLAFDEFARTAGSRAFRASVGGLGCPYKFLVPVQLPILADAIDLWALSVSVGATYHRTASQAALQLLGQLVKAFAAIPLACAVGLQLTKYCMGLRGAAELAYCGLVALLTCTVLAIIDPIDGVLHPYLLGLAVQPQQSAAPFILYCLGLGAVTAFAYRQPHIQAAKALRPESATVRAPPTSASPTESDVHSSASELFDAAGTCVHSVDLN